MVFFPSVLPHSAFDTLHGLADASSYFLLKVHDLLCICLTKNQPVLMGTYVPRTRIGVNFFSDAAWKSSVCWAAPENM